MIRVVIVDNQALIRPVSPSCDPHETELANPVSERAS